MTRLAVFRTIIRKYDYVYISDDQVELEPDYLSLSKNSAYSLLLCWNVTLDLLP